MNNPLRRLFPAVWPFSKNRQAHARRLLAGAATCALEPLEQRQLLTVAVDVRLPGGGNALTIDGTALNQPIQMEIWARTTGLLPGDPAYNNVANDGLATVVGSILSTNDPAGGAAFGLLSATLESFYVANGSSNGQQVDLDSDGDLDVGSNNDATSAGFMFARHDPPNDAGILTYGNPLLDGQGRQIGVEQLIGTVTFTPQLLLDGVTRIGWRVRAGTNGAIWFEEYQAKDTASNPQGYVAGTSVAITYDKPDAAPPAAVISASDFSAGGQYYAFSVTYTDDKGLNLATIGSGDLTVRRDDILYSQPAEFVGYTGSKFSATATYRVTAPGGDFWNNAVNGAYTIDLAAGAVTDVVGKQVAPGTTTFDVDIAADSELPTAVVSAGPVTSSRNVHTVTVTFSDVSGLGLETLTIDGDEIIVTAEGSAVPLTVTLAGTSGDQDNTIATYNVTGPTNGSWSYASNGTYNVTVVAGSVQDRAGNGVAEATGSFESTVPLDEVPPTGAISAPILTTFGGGAYLFTVVYSDNFGINASTIGAGDLVVYGPNGFVQNAALLAVSATDNGTPRTATYTITAPNGQWDARANGDYSIYFISGAVTDTSNLLAQVPPVTFQVAVPPGVMSGSNLVIYGSEAANAITLSGTKTRISTSVDGVKQTFSTAGLRRIYVYGYGGDDVITVGKGVGATRIYGGAGNDVLTGGSGADVIYGEDGNDLIKGGAGNDLLKGGAGNDRIYGGDGNDKLYGDAGTDRLYGQNGNDVLYGNDGVKDILDGGADTDTAKADTKDLLKGMEKATRTETRA